MAVKKGDTIVVEYEGRFEDGQVFDSSQHGDHSHPLTFTVGANQVISGFDSAAIGMKIGQKKEITIQSKDAYGERNENLQQKIPRSALQADKEPEVGMVLGIRTPDGRQAAAPIIAVEKDSITLDLNHPLAGKTLIFKLKVVEIKTTKEEPK